MKRVCQECSQYKKQIEDLKEQLAYVKFELEDLRSKRYKPNKKKPPDDTLAPYSPSLNKKRGGLFGHIGWFRKKPRTIDRVEDVTKRTKRAH